MNTGNVLLACLFCLAVNPIIGDEDANKVVVRKSDDDSFFAARGRRSGDSSDGAASADDFFWANRGKRSPGGNHFLALRDQGNFNVPRPNGFFFPSAGKRASSYNIPRPNGFFFPSATGKRGLSRFFGSSHQKRASGFKREGFNLPRPNGFLFPSKLQKRNRIWNMVKPNGFFFPSQPQETRTQVQPDSGKRSAEEDSDDDVEEGIELYNLLSSLFSDPDVHYLVDEDDESERPKRNSYDESTFFAGRGKKSDVDLGDAFFAGRGKKDVDADLAAFFAGRGKKGDVGDIFFAGRG